jgi:hypothetical protein
VRGKECGKRRDEATHTWMPQPPYYSVTAKSNKTMSTHTHIHNFTHGDGELGDAIPVKVPDGAHRVAELVLLDPCVVVVFVWVMVVVRGVGGLFDWGFGWVGPVLGGVTERV